MKTVKLTQLCTIKGGIPAPKKTALMGNVPFVRMRELGDAHLSSTFSPGQEFLTEADEKIFTDKIIEPGAVLFPRSGSVHLNHRAHLESKTTIVSHIGALIPKQETDSLFLYHLLTDYDMTEIMTQTTGLNMIRFSQLADVEFQIPDTLHEQTKIAEILSTVDHAIEQTEALIAKQQRIKTGMMQDLLTRGIDEDGNLRSEQTHEFKDSPLGRIPVEWKVSPAHSLCLAVIDCKNRTPPESKDGHPVIRTPNVRASKFVFKDLLYTDSKSYKVWTVRGKPQSGDVVITREAPFGEACMIPEEVLEPCLGQRMMMYKPDLSRLRNDFLLYAIYSERVQKRLMELAGGSTVGHVKVGDIRDLLIPYPVNPEEQDEIAGALNETSNALERYTRELGKLRLVKTALMQDLLTGKKRVTPLLTEPQETIP